MFIALYIIKYYRGNKSTMFLYFLGLKMYEIFLGTKKICNPTNFYVQDKRKSYAVIYTVISYETERICMSIYEFSYNVCTSYNSNFQTENFLSNINQG